MDCFTCDKTAIAACRFCGRGACRTHARTHPFLLEIFRGEKHRGLRSLVVEDAVHCGVCKPRGEPVDLPELE